MVTSELSLSSEVQNTNESESEKPDNLLMSTEETLVHNIDISQPFTEQFTADITSIPQDVQDKIEPLIIQKVQEEFLKDPQKEINKDFIAMLSPETIAQLPEDAVVNSKTMQLLSVPQIRSLPNDVIVRFIVENVNLGKALFNQFSENLRYVLTPQKEDFDNDRIAAIEKILLPQLKSKINSTFASNPATSLDSSFVKYITRETITNINGAKIKATTLLNMDVKQIQALDVDKLTLNEINALINQGNKEIILTIFKNISDLLPLFKKSPKNMSQAIAFKIDSFFQNLSSDELEMLKNESKDVEIRNLATEILAKKNQERESSVDPSDQESQLESKE